ncbi:MAG: DUF488 family protein [Saccharofermentanales bacterium]|jgi:hypothetical protein
MKKDVLLPTYKRQRFLLAFVRQLKDCISITDLQKLVFLYTMSEDSRFYDFVPYKFGPYSFQLKEDLDILQRDSFIRITINQESTRIKAIGEYTPEFIFNIAIERGKKLLRKAYLEYPYYAINSEIIDRLFTGKELNQFNQNKPSFSQTEQTLFTIGYEGKSIEMFVNSLIQNNIHLLCDVRKNPLSHKFGFSQKRLKHIVQTVGIKYTHIPELGIESQKRSSLKTHDDYASLFSEYGKGLHKMPQLFNAVYDLLLDNNRIALMCFESDPKMCHRHVIRDLVTSMWPVKSIDI